MKKEGNKVISLFVAILFIALIFAGMTLNSPVLLTSQAPSTSPCRGEFCVLEGTAVNKISSDNFAYDSGTSEITPLKNNETYLNTPTYDGLNQTVHPDIVYFPKSWHGYNYWMVVTPYPHSNDRYENPSILVSNDGYSWEVPFGLKNPIDPPPLAGHNNDPDMIYNPETDELWVYYLESGNGTTYLYRQVSPDGIMWGAKKIVLSVPDYEILSPAIVKVGHNYYMWYVNSSNFGCRANRTEVEYRTSTDGTSWSSPEKVNIGVKGYNLWHVNVIYVPSKGQYWMLTNAYPFNDTCGNTTLFFATSKDGISWSAYQNPVLSTSANGWDSTEIYRSAFLYDRSNDMLRVWYSARTSQEWHIGYTQERYSDLVGIRNTNISPLYSWWLWFLIIIVIATVLFIYLKRSNRVKKH